MKMKLCTDEELYPTVATDNKYGQEFDIPDKLAKEFIIVEKRYFKLQEKLTNVIQKIYDERRSTAVDKSI